MMTEFKHTQRDYPLSFKIAVVEQVEKGEMTYKQAQQRYGIQGRSTVLVWLRKYGRLDWGPLGKRKISHAKTIFYTVTVCCFALTLRIVCRVVRNSLAIALILAPDLMRSSTFCVCSSFNTGGRPKRFPASRALAIPE